MDVSGKLAIFLATSGHSGVDRIMKNLIPAIADRGVRVDLLRVRKHGPYLTNPHTNVRIVDLNRAHTYSCLRPLIDYLRRQKPFALLSDKDRVNRVALLAKKFSGVETRVSVRTGTTVSRDLAARSIPDTWLHYLSMHFLYRMAGAIIVPSQGAAADLAEFARLPIERVQVVPNPVITPDIFRQGAQAVDHPWLTDKKAPVILGVGELSARKDFETLIRAFQRVDRKRSCRLIILGRGRQKERLENLTLQLNLADRISMPGFVENPYKYLARADLFVQSSAWEGFGNALVEALAFGTPVVSTDCPSGPKEVLQNGRYGKLVPVKDPASMANAILQSLENPPNPDDLRQACRPYQLDNSVDRYLTAMGFIPNDGRSADLKPI